MAITVFSLTTYAAPSGGGGFTTSGVDLTGCTNIVICQSSYTAGTATVSDNSSGANTINTLTPQSSSEPVTSMYWIDNPSSTNLNNYKVTVTGSSGFSAIAIYGLKGGSTSGSYDTTAGTDPGQQNNSGGTSVQVNSNFTPTNDNEILICALAYSAANSPGISGGSFGAVTKQDYVGGQNEGLAVSSWIQTTATAVQPTWSWGSGTRGVVLLAAFQAAAAGGGTFPPAPSLQAVMAAILPQ